MVRLKEKERHEEREKEKHTIYDISNDIGGETRVAHVRDVRDRCDMCEDVKWQDFVDRARDFLTH